MSKRKGRRSDASSKGPSSAGGVRKPGRQHEADDPDPHDGVPTFMRIELNKGNHGGAATSVVDGSQALDERAKSVEQRDNVSLDEVNVVTYNMCYQVSAVNDLDNPDVLRKDFHVALDYLSLLFRDHPTLPGDPANPLEEFPASASRETALLLPSKHCAFRGCSWCGKDVVSHDDVF